MVHKAQIHLSLFLLALWGNTISVQGQSKIKDNTVSGTSSFPHEGAILETESSNKGVLLPRVSLSNTTTWSLAGSAMAGMVVYNNNAGIDDTITAEALAGGIGFYYWDGARWVGMGTGIADFWGPKGNPGTISPVVTGIPVGSAHYLGTADAQNLALATNGITRVILDRQGNVYGGFNTIAHSAAQNALVWGANNTDSAEATLVSGYNNVVFPSGKASVVAGENQRIGSSHSAVFGQDHQDSAKHSLVAGLGNILTPAMPYATVLGSYNAPVDSALLTVGNGVSSARSNAFIITNRQTTGATESGESNGLIIISAPLPQYSRFINVYSDPSLPSGAFYKIGDAVFQKQ